jgi:hypothetical protein
MRMQDQGDRRAGARPRIETAFETAFGAGKNDFGHSDPIRTECRQRRMLVAKAERPI